MSRPTPLVYLVSDATGRTVERLAQAALVQFADADVQLVRRGNVQSAEGVRAVVQEAADSSALILHTLVADELRRVMLAESRTQGVDALDLMGPLMERLAAHLELKPQERPGLFAQLGEAKAREIEAVSFAFRHDDGQNIHELRRAEVVLVGVSRTMKTPTMLYMAYRGWFAANVPLAPELPVPAELLAVSPSRVFCLTMSAPQLIELRRTRALKENIPIEPYATAGQVRKELDFVGQLCRTHQWQVVEVSSKSVEEVCREIIQLLP